MHTIHNLLRAVLALSIITSNLTAHTEITYKRISKEKIIKAAKILGYTTELAISGTFYYRHVMASLATIGKALKAENQKRNWRGIVEFSGLHFPFFASMGHALYGLQHELSPAATMALKKLNAWRNKQNIEIIA
jgi:hypothetical protein